jgi:hypothetical protein
MKDDSLGQNFITVQLMVKSTYEQNSFNVKGKVKDYI